MTATQERQANNGVPGITLGDHQTKSLRQCRCPDCRRRGVYSELEYDSKSGENECPKCGLVLIGETR